MNGPEMTSLIEMGATDSLRSKLKRYGIADRMKHLAQAIPFVGQSEKTLEFFRENFSQEIGALLLSGSDTVRATALYKANSILEKENKRKHNVKK